MDTKVATRKSLAALIDLYDLHTRLFANVIDGVSAEDSNNRLGTRANHPAWIAGSLVQQRYEMAKTLGVYHEPAFHDLFCDNKGIQDGVDYPALPDYKADWEKITPVLRQTMLQLNHDQLGSIAPVDMGQETTYYEMTYFSIHREAYCIGQLGLWRRLLGYKAMKYQ